MNHPADLVSAANAAGLLLSRRGEHLHIESPLGRPLPEDLRLRLLEGKEAVLAWLDWCEVTDGLLLACSSRLVRTYPVGLPLDGERWRIAEEALQRAHRLQDLEIFDKALADYERFAKAQFQQPHDRER
jgi:hypothetical protein